MSFECNLAQQMTTTCLATVSCVTIFTQARKLVVISCWRFGATYRYYLQRTVRNHHYLLPNNPEWRSSHLLGSESLKSCIDVPAVHIYFRFWWNLVQQICTARLKEGCTFLSGFNEIRVAGSMKTYDGFKAQSVLAKSVHDVTKCTTCNCPACQNTIRYTTMHRPSACPNLDNTEHWQQRVCAIHRFLK